MGTSVDIQFKRDAQSKARPEEHRFREVTGLAHLRDMCCARFQVKDEECDLWNGSLRRVDASWHEFLDEESDGQIPEATMQLKVEYDQPQPPGASHQPTLEAPQSRIYIEDPADATSLTRRGALAAR